MEKNVGFNISSKKSKDTAEFESLIEDLVIKTNILEDQIFEIKNQISSGEEGIFSIGKKVKKEIEDIRQEVLELKQVIDNIKGDFDKIAEEVNMSARKTDLEILYKYVKMWDPMSFVRREELERLLDDGTLKKKDLKE